VTLTHGRSVHENVHPLSGESDFVPLNDHLATFLSILPAVMKVTPATSSDKSSRIATHSHMFVIIVALPLCNSFVARS
jgi:hypothetical protein